MASNGKSVNVSMGLSGWLFIVLLILKLNPGGQLTTVVADWSWWWVTAPLWLPLVLAFVLILIALTIAAFIDAVKGK